MWPISPRATFLAAGMVAALLAGGAGGYRLGKASGERDVRKMLEAGQEAAARRDVQINALREKGNEDADRIATLSRGARVRVCPPVADRLPGSSDASPAGDGGEAGEYIEDILRQCLRSFGEINRAVKSQ